MKKTVLITGSAKGIGKACIEKFASKGYNVVINYLTSEKQAIELKNAVENLYGVKALCIKADISNEDEVKNMISKVINVFGKIDVLINNANYEQDNHFLEKTKEEFLSVLEVNVVGTFLVTKYASKNMDNGTVINVSSLDATDTYRELSMDYCASKAGMNSLAQTFSLALPNIKFISIMLPWVKTESVEEMFEEYLENELKKAAQERLIETEEVAEKIYSLVDDRRVKSGDVIKFKYFNKKGEINEAR